MVVRIGVGNAAAAGRDAREPAFVERLQVDQKSTGTCHLLRVDQLFPAAELAGRTPKKVVVVIGRMVSVVI